MIPPISLTIPLLLSTLPALADATKPPIARRSDFVEELHGVKVADPYRWMEEIDSAETRAWLEAQGKFTADFLSKLPRRAEIHRQLSELWNYDRVSLPRVEAGRHFFSKKLGLRNQPLLFWKESATAQPRVLLDPNTLSQDGTVALSGWRVSRDGKLIAYGLSTAGSDWVEWRFREVDSGKDWPDVLKWVKFSSPTWTHDNQGVFYSRYDEPKPGQELKQKNENQKLYFHRLGTAQTEDELIYARPDQPKWGFGAGLTDDGAYLLLSIWAGSASKNALFYQTLSPEGKRGPMVEFCKDWDAEYDFVGNEGATFFILTDKDAPNRRLVEIDLAKPAPSDWKTVIAETNSPIASVSYLSGKFIVTRMVDAHDQVTVHDRSGNELQKLPLPSPCSASGFGGRHHDTETYYSITSYTLPSSIYKLDLATGTSTLVEETEVAFDPKAFEAKQVFYQSKDGTRVPMFICHKKGIKLDASNATLLTGYGGFDNALTPYFSPTTIVWMQLGGVWAQPNLRGGSEYGKAWHDGGRLGNKQNVFDDFIAAAEWLIREKYTSTPKLAIAGGSNGGLLVAACLNQRPELFGAAIPAVGVHDMLRFHKFTIGWAWQEEYGSPDDPKAFAWLHKYSPLHNLQSQKPYPPTLILTGDHDDRVFPAHSFKYAAALQHAQSGPAPILLRVDFRAGHGAGKPTQKALNETADKFAFLAEALKM